MRRASCQGALSARRKNAQQARVMRSPIWPSYGNTKHGVRVELIPRNLCTEISKSPYRKSMFSLNNKSAKGRELGPWARPRSLKSSSVPQYHTSYSSISRSLLSPGRPRRATPHFSKHPGLVLITRRRQAKIIFFLQYFQKLSRCCKNPVDNTECREICTWLDRVTSAGITIL